MIVRLYEEGIMQTAVENKHPYVIDWGAATTDLPKIMGVIWVDDTIEGYIAMQCTKTEINEERMRAMAIMQKFCHPYSLHQRETVTYQYPKNHPDGHSISAFPDSSWRSLYSDLSYRKSRSSELYKKNTL